MGAKFNNSDILKTRFNGVEAKALRLNGTYVWAKPYVVSIQNNGTSITITRLSSNEPSAHLGEITNGEYLYFGDTIEIIVTPNQGYHDATITAQGCSSTSTPNVYTVTGTKFNRELSKIAILGHAIRNTWNAIVNVYPQSTYTNAGLTLSNVSYPYSAQIIKADGTIITEQLNYNDSHLFAQLDYDDKVRIIRNVDVSIPNDAYTSNLGTNAFNTIQRKKVYEISAPETHNARKSINLTVLTSSEEYRGYESDWKSMNDEDNCFEIKCIYNAIYLFQYNYPLDFSLFVRRWDNTIAYSQLDNVRDDEYTDYIISEQPESVIYNEASIHFRAEGFYTAQLDEPIGIKILYKYYAGITVTTINP